MRTLPLLVLFACTGGEPTEAPVPFRVWSPDHVTSEGHPRAEDCENWLPQRFECTNPNPEIRWEGVPDGTVSLALVFDDPDAGDFPHWAIYDLDPALDGLDAGISGDGIANSPPGAARELDNGAGFNGYLGSCPGGTNLYRWRLFALDAALDRDFGSFDALVDATQDVRIERTNACHVYGPRTQ